MKTFVLAAAVVSGLAACASDEEPASSPPDLGQRPPPEPDASADTDAAPVTGPCEDCEYFPESCEADVLCPNGPFDAKTAGGAFDLRTQINVVRGRSKSDVWVAGAAGAIAHFDGATWTRSEAGAEVTLNAIWLRDGQEIALGQLDTIYMRGGGVPDAGVSAGGWTFQEPAVVAPRYPSSRNDVRRLESAWAPADGEWLWAATRAVISRSGLWRLRARPDGTFEIGAGTTCCQRMRSVHGSSRDTLWAVGHDGVVLRVSDAQGDTPTYQTFNSQTWNALHGVWSASASDVWAVGSAGTIRHYTGHPVLWDIIADVPTSGDLNAVWGASPSDIWAVGDRGLALHYDGETWSRVKIAGLGDRRPDLMTVWMPEPGHVWIGGQGVVLSLGGKR